MEFNVKSLKYLFPLLFIPALAVAEPLMPTEEWVAGLILKAKESCAIDGGVLDLSGDEIVRYDFDNDGRTDLTVLHEFEYECSSSASLFQGTAGAVAHLMTDVDYLSGYARQVLLITIFKDVPTIVLGLHGGSCGEAGFVPCAEAITIHEGQFIR